MLFTLAKAQSTQRLHVFIISNNSFLTFILLCGLGALAREKALSIGSTTTSNSDRQAASAKMRGC
jgi:hypothetical protein